MSLAVFLISLAVSVYFAEPIRAVIPINLLLLLILVHIVYKVVCKRVYEVERILLILTPQKWGVIIVQKGKKNILII